MHIKLVAVLWNWFINLRTMTCECGNGYFDSMKCRDVLHPLTDCYSRTVILGRTLLFGVNILAECICAAESR
jgi:hypothetical protein